MWKKDQEKKMIFLLNINNYSPEITKLTYPYIERYAEKIKADIHVINERKFPDWDMDYEKLQIHELGREYENDWNIYFDSDALLHPDLPDITELLHKNTVAHNGSDLACIRWTYDKYFWRDGRHIGSCNWCAIGSDWCLDLWRPLDDMTMEEAIKNIRLTRDEELSGVLTKEHLVSDYALSRNIARFGLKFVTLNSIFANCGNFFWHTYTIPVDEKIVELKRIIREWKI